VTLGVLTAGAVMSFVNVSVELAVVFPAASLPVTTSVGELLVEAFQLKVFES
jgi:hypothetical protein